MPKQIFVSNLQVGETIDNEPFGIAAVKHATDKNNNPYVDIELVDKTGSLKGKIWSDNLLSIDKSLLKTGTIVNIKANVSEFNGAKQLTIYSITSCEDADDADFVAKTKADIDELWKYLTARIEQIDNDRIKKLLEILTEKYEDKIKISPAARGVHHHYVGGLLEHVVEMLKLAEVICDLYEEADQDLVTAGIIMHDIGKLYELKLNGFSIEYTPVGKLVGHIVLGIQILDNLDDDILKKKERMLLTHIILSHHSILEFGSPVVPRIIEAMIVAKIDDLSSKVRLVQKVMANNESTDADFSSREFGLDGEIYLRR